MIPSFADGKKSVCFHRHSFFMLFSYHGSPPQAEHEAARCGQAHDGTAAPQAEHGAAPRPSGGAAGQQAARRPETQTEGTA